DLSQCGVCLNCGPIDQSQSSSDRMEGQAAPPAPRRPPQHALGAGSGPFVKVYLIPE
ncbi:hypothetical protein KUCAC02_001866, partial [Chaenocephalus aceratus]